MNPIRSIARASLALALALVLAASQDARAQTAADWAKATAPGPEHKALAARVGKWTSTIKAWSDPKAEPTVSQASHELTMIAAGRFLREEVRSDASGAIYEGTGYTGYDNLQKKYVAVWMDTLGTAMRFTSGTADGKDGKTLNMTALASSSFRSTWKMSGADKMTVEMFGPGADGKEMKFMEISYTRAK